MGGFTAVESYEGPYLIFRKGWKDIETEVEALNALSSLYVSYTLDFPTDCNNKQLDKTGYEYLCFWFYIFQRSSP